MKSGIYEPGNRDRWLEQLPTHSRQLAQLLGEQLDELVEAHSKARRWLCTEWKRVPVVRLVQTAPGIGDVRAAQIVATVISPHRFRTRRQFWQYCGLGVVTRVSSEWTKDSQRRWRRQRVPQTRGLNRNRQPMLKNVFKGAAETVVWQMSKHPLHQSYQRMLEAGTKPNLAKLTLARRIAGAVLAMWKNNERYDVAKQT